MFKLWVVLTFTIASIGGVTYGEAPNAEGVPTTSEGQAARPVEEIPAERKEEDRGQKHQTERGQIGNDTEQPGTFTAGRRTSPDGNKQETVQRRLGSGTQDSQRLQGTEQATAQDDKAPGKRNKSHDDSNYGLSAYGYLGHFDITAYTAGYESTQKKKGEPGYGITATGTTVKEGRTIAADWDVLPPGTVVQIEGLEGTYTVEDRGGGVKGNHIDLYLSDLQHALEWGRQKRSVWVVKWGLMK